MKRKRRRRFRIIAGLLFLCAILTMSGCAKEKDTITSLKDVNQPSFRLGVIQGSAANGAASEKVPNAEIQYFNSIPDGCAAVKAGKIDGFSFDSSILSYYTLNDPQAVVMDEGLSGVDLCGGMRKSDTELAAKLNRFIADAKRDGLLDEMKARWFETTDHDLPKLQKPKNPEGTLRILTDGLSEPYSYTAEGGAVKGYDIELGMRFAYSMNMDVSVVPLTFDALIPALESGKGDIILCALNATPERREKILFSDPYFVSDIGILVDSERYAGAGKNKDGGTAMEKLKANFIGTFIKESRWKLIAKGLGVTVLISICAFLLGSVWGAVLCLMKESKRKLLTGFTDIYIRVIDGIPILVLLMVLYYIVFRTVDLPGIAVAIIGFALNLGAVLAEIFKTGIDSVDKGQKEAAAAMGFKPFAVFHKIVLPQAANHIFGLYKGQFVSLIKSTSIVGYIAIMDLTKVSDIIRSRTYAAFFPILTTALIYFLLICISIALLTAVEHKLDPKRRKRRIKGVNIHD